VVGYGIARSRAAARRTPGGSHDPGGGAAEIALSSAGSPEEQQAVASIVRVLNEIDFQVHDLDATLRARGAGYRFSAQEASAIVDRFFSSCQVAEERIKSARAGAAITADQEAALNRELHATVRRMLALTGQAETLAALARERAGTDVIS
jgi:hypothetical protein